MQHVSKNNIVLLKAISEVLREERLKKGKSVRMLAYEYDLQMSLLSRIENAKNDSKITSLWSICNALDIQPNYFFTRVMEKLPENFTLLE